jgi:hypothetical protein
VDRREPQTLRAQPSEVPKHLTDEEWQHVEPLIPLAKPGGRKREVMYGGRGGRQPQRPSGQSYRRPRGAAQQPSGPARTNLISVVLGRSGQQVIAVWVPLFLTIHSSDSPGSRA